MIEVAAALVVLAFLALIVCVVLLVLRGHTQQRAMGEALNDRITLCAHALAEQLAADREEHRNHLDAAATALVAQLTPRRERSAPAVEVRAAPPLVRSDEEATLPAGTVPASSPPSRITPHGGAVDGLLHPGRTVHLALLIADVIDRATRIHAPGSFAVCVLELSDEHARGFAALLHLSSPAGSDPAHRAPACGGRSFLTRAAAVDLMARVCAEVLGEEIAAAVLATHAARRVPVVLVSEERAIVRAFIPDEAS